jgi:hypothetical protein
MKNDRVVITSRELVFAANLETQLAPRTVEAFVSRLPMELQLVQARWSGESGWIPLGDADFGVVELENSMSRPRPGQILFHPCGKSETEILFPYGETVFGSKVGPLMGSHFLTIDQGLSGLALLGHRLLWEGAQPIRFELESNDATGRDARPSPARRR